MGPSEQTKKSLEKARAALQAETREAVQVSRGLTDNLAEASRRTWRQLSIISAIVLVLGLSYLAILVYGPITTNFEVQKKKPGLPQVSGSPIPAVPESGNLLKILDQIREAHYKKDIRLFVAAYSPTFPDLTQKEELTLKGWQRYDYLDLNYSVTGLQQKNATTISGIVTWNIKTRDLKNDEIKTFSKEYQVKFSKESGQWRIQDIEALNNKEK